MCGMPYGSAGIVELAEIDQKNSAALSDAQTLLTFSSVPWTYFLVCLVVGALIPEAAITYAFVAFIGFAVFCWKFFAWPRKYGNNEYPDESFYMAARLRRGSAVIALAGLFAVAFLFYKRVL
jgi:hypothetical protein